MNVYQIFKNLGLDEKETAVYMAALELNDSPIQQIAQKAKIKRTSAYLIIQKLIEKGLLGSYEDKAGLKIMAESPKIVLAKYKRSFEELEKIIPELTAITKDNYPKPKVSHYQGKEGYRFIIENALEKHGKEILFIGNVSKLHEIIGMKYDFEAYVPTRIKRRIKIKMLVFQENIQTITASYQQNDIRELREIKILPQEYFFMASALIYNNKVAFFSSKKELSVTLIESQEINEMEKQKFYFIWKNAVNI